MAFFPLLPFPLLQARRILCSVSPPLSVLPVNPAQHHPAADAAAERLRALAEQHLPHARLWLFGSRAKGTYFRRSDFDVAVEPRVGFSDREYMDWLDALENDSDIIYAVDTHRMDEIPADWVARIRKEGVVWKD